MNQKIEQVTEEVANEAFPDQTAAPSGLILTTSGMIEFLLQAGLPASRIEDRIGAEVGFVKNALNDETVFDEGSAVSEVKRLRILYLRENLKFIYRKSPFTGSKKAAHKLGVTKKEFDSIYDGLISSGELKYKISIPTWGDPEKRAPLREHVVVG